MSQDTLSFEMIIPTEALSKQEYRQWITSVEQRIENIVGTFDRNNNDLTSLVHRFTPGLYSRELTMPKGALIVSRIHLHEHPFVISKGDVSVYDGEKVQRLKAPYSGITKPGTKRILFIHEETVWTTFHTVTEDMKEHFDEDGVITCSTFEQCDAILLER